MGPHAAATLLANNALAAAAVVAHQLQSFTQKPSNAIVNMRLHNQLQNQRIANAILTNTAPNRSVKNSSLKSNNVKLHC